MADAQQAVHFRRNRLIASCRMVALLGIGSRFDTTLTQMVTFLILTRIISMLFTTRAGDEISAKINDGSIANDFALPLNFKLYLLCSELGGNLFKCW